MDPIKGNDFLGNQSNHHEKHSLLRILSYRPSRTFSLIALLLISVMLPVAVFVAQQQQTYQQQAAEVACEIYSQYDCERDDACIWNGTSCQNKNAATPTPGGNCVIIGGQTICNTPTPPLPTKTPFPGQPTPTPGAGMICPTPGAGNLCSTPGAPVSTCNTPCPLANDPNTCGGHKYCVYNPGGNCISTCQCETAEQTCQGAGGGTPTPTPGVIKCDLIETCNGAECTFTNTFFINGVQQTNYLSTLQPHIDNDQSTTGWCTNRTFTHTYSSADSGPYIAELNVGFGTISTDANGDGCQDSGNPPDLQWQFACRETVLEPGPPRCKSGLIEGNVYVDANRNGNKDSGETNYRGATVELSGEEDEVEITNGDGNYQFDDLPEGQYQVEVSVEGYEVTDVDPNDTPNLDSCGDQDEADFGIIRSTVNPTPTRTPTPPPGTPTPTPTIPPGGTRLSFTLYLQGVGLEANGDNKDPGHPERTIAVQIFNQTNTQVGGDTSGTVRFDPARGLFTGTADVNNLASGAYTVKVKSNQYLRKLIVGIQNIVDGATNNMPQTALVVGDINNDNKLDITDYNQFVSCYNKIPVTATCSSSDLNDDGKVDGIDYNYFIRSLSVEEGD